MSLIDSINKRSKKHALGTLETASGSVTQVFTDPVSGNTIGASVLVDGQKKALYNINDASGLKLNKSARVKINTVKGNRNDYEIIGVSGTAGGANVVTGSTSVESAVAASPNSNAPNDFATYQFVIYGDDPDLKLATQLLGSDNIDIAYAAPTGADDTFQNASITLTLLIPIDTDLPDPDTDIIADGAFACKPGTGDTVELWRYDLTSTTWQQVGDGGGSVALIDLTDVDTTGLADGQILFYDNGTTTFKFKDNSFSTLSDVDDTSKADTYIPSWDAGSSKIIWIPQPSGGGGGINVVTTIPTADVTTRAKLYAKQSPVGIDYQADVLALSPTHVWTLDDASGSIFADSVGSKDLTAVGSPVFGQPQGPTTPTGSHSINNNGGGGTQTAFSDWGTLTALTMIIWYKPVSNSGHKHLIGSRPATGDGGNGAEMLHLSGTWDIYDNSASMMTLDYTSDWNMLVVTFDGTNRRAYCNGTIRSTVAYGVPGTPYPGGDARNQYFTIGITSDGNFGTTGYLDEAAFFPVALSGADISALYATATTPVSIEDDTLYIGVQNADTSYALKRILTVRSDISDKPEIDLSGIVDGQLLNYDAASNSIKGITSSSVSPYTVPLMSTDFTAGNTPSGATHTDKSTGLVMTTENAGGSLVLHTINDNNSPGATFKIITRMHHLMGTNNSGCGIFVGDGTKVVTFGIDSASANMGNVNYWNSVSSFNSNPTNLDTNTPSKVFCVEYDGTNFYYSSGNDINSLILIGSYSATAFLSGITVVGLYSFGYTQKVVLTCDHYLHTI